MYHFNNTYNSEKLEPSKCTYIRKCINKLQYISYKIPTLWSPCGNFKWRDRSMYTGIFKSNIKLKSIMILKEHGLRW